MQIEEYLTTSLKAKYREDFHVLTNYMGSEFWDLDEGLLDLLSSINELECLQTLYSKRHTSFREFALERKSYLQITFRKEKEVELFNVLNNICLVLQNEDSEIEILKEPPSHNSNYKGDSKIPLGCLNDPDYFRLYSYTISITSNLESDHERFFGLLKEKLSMLDCSS
jgi:hypothetical protein